jgi:hypothetical protein
MPSGMVNRLPSEYWLKLLSNELVRIDENVILTAKNAKIYAKDAEFNYYISF